MRTRSEGGHLLDVGAALLRALLRPLLISVETTFEFVMISVHLALMLVGCSHTRSHAGDSTVPEFARRLANVRLGRRQTLPYA